VILEAGVRVDAGRSLMDVLTHEYIPRGRWNVHGAIISLLVVAPRFPMEVIWVAASLVVAKVGAFKVNDIHQGHVWVLLLSAQGPEMNGVVALQLAVLNGPVQVQLAVSRLSGGEGTLPARRRSAGMLNLPDGASIPELRPLLLDNRVRQLKVPSPCSRFGCAWDAL